ncbi:hypothetical protein AB0C27_52670 [Nonomuraea sp. NPDC048882]
MLGYQPHIVTTGSSFLGIVFVQLLAPPPLAVVAPPLLRRRSRP